MTPRHLAHWAAAVVCTLAVASTGRAQQPRRTRAAAGRAVAASARALLLRPPAVPLVTHDPYFSIWSPADRLTDAGTVHWTGRAHPLNSLIRVDGAVARLMGARPSDVAALPQTSVTVRPTHTIYTFRNAQVRVTLTFMTPSLPYDLDLLSRPVTYISWTVASADGKSHRVELYLDVGADIAVNTTDQPVQLDYPKAEGLAVARVGTTE